MKDLFALCAIYKVIKVTDRGKYVDDLNQPLNDVEKTLNSLGIVLRTSAEDWRDPKYTWGIAA